MMKTISVKTCFNFIIPAFLIAGSAISAGAQTKTDKATVVEGPEVETKRSSFADVLGSDESGYYTLRREKKDIFLEHSNRQMQVDKSVALPDQKKGKEPIYFDACRMLSGELFLFSMIKDSRENSMELVVQKIDKQTLTPDAEMKTLSKTTMPSRRAFMQSLAFGSFFSQITSPDGSLLLLKSSDMGKDDNGNAPTDIRYHFAVYGKGMEKQWEKDIKLPFLPDQFSVEQIKIDDDGNVFLIGIEYQEKAEARISRREGKPSYAYHLYRYSNKGTDVLEMPVKLKEKFITDMQAGNAPNGDIIIAGFYSDKGTFSVKGAFYLSIDGKTHQEKIQSLSEFDSEFITQYFSEKEKKKQKKQEAKGEEPELYSFRMDELLLRNDGGATMIAEQYYTYTVTYTTTDANGRMTTHSTTYYNYNDILVLSFNPDGSLNWKCKVPKRQTTASDGGYYSSYAYATIGDKIYFVFNDNPKNLFLKPGEKPYAFTGSKELAVVLVEVTGSGETSRELLFTIERGDVILRPKVCVQTGEKEMFICSERTKIYQLARVEFK